MRQILLEVFEFSNKALKIADTSLWSGREFLPEFLSGTSFQKDWNVNNRTMGKLKVPHK